MNLLDWIIVGVLVLSMLVSVLRGFMREIIGLVTWASAFVVGIFYASRLAPFLPQAVDSPTARLAIGFGLLFLLVLLVGGIINLLVSKFIQKTGLSGTDRSIGLFFGALRAVLIITVAVMLAGFTSLPREAWWQQSMLLEYFTSLALWLAEWLPPDFQAAMRKGLG